MATSDGTAPVTPVDPAHAKYGDMTDDQIDTLIDIRVQQGVNKWIIDIGRVQLETIINVNDAKARAAMAEANEVTKSARELRRVMLEYTQAKPVPEPDADMEALLKP